MNDDDQRLVRWLARWQSPPADPAAKARLKAAIGTALPSTMWERQRRRWRDWLEDVRSGGVEHGGIGLHGGTASDRWGCCCRCWRVSSWQG